MSRERDLLASILRTIEDQHAPGCASALGHSCTCYVNEVAAAIIDLDIEPCVGCAAKEAITTDDNHLPLCAECAAVSESGGGRRQRTRPVIVSQDAEVLRAVLQARTGEIEELLRATMDTPKLRDISRDYLKGNQSVGDAVTLIRERTAVPEVVRHRGR